MELKNSFITDRVGTRRGATRGAMRGARSRWLFVSALALLVGGCAERPSEGRDTGPRSGGDVSGSPSAIASASAAEPGPSASPSTPGFPVIKQGKAGPKGKRVAPQPVAPVVEGGVRYTAPHFVTDATGMEHNGGYVEAVDAGTSKRIWLKEIYRYAIQQGTETDVQDVFVTSMQIESGALRVTDEQGGSYLVPLSAK